MRGAAGGRLLFVATILTGSFLLFLIQPMVARMALPRLGGAPNVWNSAMLVYQALLLAGYAYAHRLSRQRLHLYTQPVTRHGDGYAYSWEPGDGTISQARSAYADGVRLTAGEAFVGVRYTFTLRAATVYGSLKFQVLGRSRAGLSSVAGLWRGAMDDPKVSADLARPYDRSRIGPAYGWWTVTKSSAHRDGRRVHAQVLVENALLLVGGGLNTYDIKAVRLVYRYALLQ